MGTDNKTIGTMASAMVRYLVLEGKKKNLSRDDMIETMETTMASILLFLSNKDGREAADLLEGRVVTGTIERITGIHKHLKSP